MKGRDPLGLFFVNQRKSSSSLPFLFLREIWFWPVRAEIPVFAFMFAAFLAIVLATTGFLTGTLRTKTLRLKAFRATWSL